ncbi:MAG TPA: hypothetical protein VL689_22870 [Paraburkholderia sp.]|nr:hypothetical protein [Paraburkholderia sp.]
MFIKGFLLALFFLAIAYAAYVVFSENRKRENTIDEQTAQLVGDPESSDSAQQQTTSKASTADAGLQSAAPTPTALARSNDVPDIPRAARTTPLDPESFDAKAADEAAMARSADNTVDARQFQSDAAASTQRRDSALQIAERCADLGAWACVRQQASEALAMDPSNARAQSLMEQAILSSAWKPLRSTAAPRLPTAPRSPSSAAQYSAAQTGAAAPLPRGMTSVPLPSSRDWDAPIPPAPKNWDASASPPPLPSRVPRPTHVANAAIAPADAPVITPMSAPANTPVTPPVSGSPANVESQNADVTTTATIQSGTVSPASTASNDNGADAQIRAILQSGWKNAKPSSDAH